MQESARKPSEILPGECNEGLAALSTIQDPDELFDKQHSRSDSKMLKLQALPLEVIILILKAVVSGGDFTSLLNFSQTCYSVRAAYVVGIVTLLHVPFTQHLIETGYAAPAEKAVQTEARKELTSTAKRKDGPRRHWRAPEEYPRKGIYLDRDSKELQRMARIHGEVIAFAKFLMALHGLRMNWNDRKHGKESNTEVAWFYREEGKEALLNAWVYAVYIIAHPRFHRENCFQTSEPDREAPSPHVRLPIFLRSKAHNLATHCLDGHPVVTPQHYCIHCHLPQVRRDLRKTIRDGLYGSPLANHLNKNAGKGFQSVYQGFCGAVVQQGEWRVIARLWDVRPDGDINAFLRCEKYGGRRYRNWWATRTKNEKRALELLRDWEEAQKARAEENQKPGI